MPAWISVGLVEDSDQRLLDLRNGLLQRPAHISPKFFYDAQGCALYSAICELAEYYPTRTEAAIFERHRDAIARRLPRGVQWVDLGCGDGAKSWPWLKPVEARRWVGVDISPEWLSMSLQAGGQQFVEVEFVGVATDFTRPLQLHHVLGQRPHWPRVFFYPGSSIGNFPPEQALALLGSVREHLGPEGRLLIGIDGVKDKAVLEAAYDDALGVTAAFNRNVLRVVNRELDADFDARRFAHRAVFNSRDSRIEMHLVAQGVQQVHLGTDQRVFDDGEAIVTEYSYKYTPESFAALLREAGFGSSWHWSDERGWFHVFVAGA
ncbi:L-histidine N(alpha)-methyltransferase [Aquabacterium sp. A7-Y]|uniref:L-histidine N(alpha)-methyltransferase n=1 Tax=Aquabacterium sp. A7-Y TaxID=1349605 RepID=UPI00223CECE9|nr:L-histidine N(alpha)-methyltransferase [Aquabacterium sp. A7-Y]MCW7539809.1 L-histidine N(alpha)-methyltransferase [Aquabacterium sp. A7-Y]